jgi:hypothetical protein
MSHFTEVKTKMYDLDILKTTLKDLQKSGDITSFTSRKNDIHSKDELIIFQDDSYETGLRWNGTEYELFVDLMSWTGVCPINNFVDRLNQRYAYNTIRRLTNTSTLQSTKVNLMKSGSIKISINT